MVRMGSSSVNGPLCEEVIPPSDAEHRDETRTKPCANDIHAKLGESSKYESKANERGDAAIYSKNQASLLADTDAWR